MLSRLSLVLYIFSSVTNVLGHPIVATFKIVVLYDNPSWVGPLPPSLLDTKRRSTSCVSSLRGFVSILLMSDKFQWITLQLYVTAGMTRVFSVSILLTEFNSYPSISFFNLLYVSTFPATFVDTKIFVCLFLFQISSSRFTFGDSTILPLLIVQFSHLFSPKDMPISSLNYFTVCFYSWCIHSQYYSMQVTGYQCNGRVEVTESAWKVPLVMIIGFEGRLPFSCDKKKTESFSTMTYTLLDI